MKLIRAEFENYRLLRDLELDFSTDNEKKLTVIRAENGTGKTTILNALQWGLYGDNALPGKGRDYRLSSIDSESLLTDGEFQYPYRLNLKQMMFQQTRTGKLGHRTRNGT